MLVSEKLISKDSRHGRASDGECDIVDEKNEIQIELITEFKSRIKKDKMPHKNIESFMLEFINSNLIHTSEALKEKFFDKEYTNKYKKGLGMFCFGDRTVVEKMLKKLLEQIKKTSVKNDYTRLYIIWYDLINDEYWLYSSSTIKPIKIESRFKIVNKKKIKYEEMDDQSNYLVLLKCIFKPLFIISYLSKKELIALIKRNNITC